METSPVQAAPAQYHSSRSQDERNEWARNTVRQLERYAYRIVSDADDPQTVSEAQVIMRLVIGLRRKLDLWGTS
jgi:phosphatidate phosphatase APP1